MAYKPLFATQEQVKKTTGYQPLFAKPTPTLTDVGIGASPFAPISLTPTISKVGIGATPIQAQSLAPTPQVSQPNKFIEQSKKSLAFTPFGAAAPIVAPILKTGLDFGKEVVRSTARNITSVINTVFETALPKEQKELVAKGTSPEMFKSKIGQEITKVILGKKTTESVLDSTEPLGIRISKAEKIIKDWASEKSKENPSSRIYNFIKNNPSKLAFTGIIASTGLDLTGYGGSDDAVKTAIKKANNVDDAFRVLKTLGVSDNVAKRYAQSVINATTDKQAIKLIDDISLVLEPQVKTPTGIIKQVDEPTKKEMIEAIDYIRLDKPKKKYSQRIEENIGYLAEKYGITSKNYEPIAKKFEELVDLTQTSRSKKLEVLTRKYKTEEEFADAIAPRGKETFNIPKGINPKEMERFITEE